MRAFSTTGTRSLSPRVKINGALCFDGENKS